MLRKEKRRGDLQLQREQVFQREHPFCPTRFASKPTTTPNCAPRYPNELTTDGEVAALATATAAGAEGVAGSGIAAVPAT